MKIETKYDIGDSFWLIRDGKAKDYKVNYLTVTHQREPNGCACYQDIITISYFGGVRNEVMTTEKEFYPTKSCLLKSL